MTRRMWGLVLLVLASEVLGVLAGHWFFRLFNATVPPAVLTSFNHATARGAFLMYGAGLGIVIAAFALVVAFAAPFFRGPRRPG